MHSYIQVRCHPSRGLARWRCYTSFIPWNSGLDSFKSSQLPKQPRQSRKSIDVQEKGNGDIPPHNLVILAKVPKHLRPHDRVVCIHVAYVAARDHDQVPFCDIRVASYNGAEHGHASKQ
jgi:hypothetical protein